MLNKLITFCLKLIRGYQTEPRDGNFCSRCDYYGSVTEYCYEHGVTVSPFAHCKDFKEGKRCQ